MATTLSAASLTVTLTESISLNGYEQGSSNAVTIASIASVFKRIVAVPLTEVTLYTNHASNVGGSTFDEDDVKYVRITNKDGTNFVDLIVANSENDEFCLRLKAGHSFVLWDQNDVLNAVTQPATITVGAGMEGVASVNAQADTAACDVEVFIASA